MRENWWSDTAEVGNHFYSALLRLIQSRRLVPRGGSDLLESESQVVDGRDDCLLKDVVVE